MCFPGADDEQVDPFGKQVFHVTDLLHVVVLAIGKDEIDRILVLLNSILHLLQHIDPPGIDHGALRESDQKFFLLCFFTGRKYDRAQKKSHCGHCLER